VDPLSGPPWGLLIIPAGMYHHFTLDESNQIQALRFTNVRGRFPVYRILTLQCIQEELQYSSRAPVSDTDSSSCCAKYLDSLKEVVVV
jgi:ARD/ARD' family